MDLYTYHIILDKTDNFLTEEQQPVLFTEDIGSE